MSVTFSDITAMLAARPPLASAAPCALVKNIAALKSDCIQLSSEWAQLIETLAQIQQKNWPQFKHPRVALYVSNYGQNTEALQNRLQKLSSQHDALTRLCGMINADLRVYELDLTTEVPATGINEIEACHAISYGLMAVEEHVDSLIVETLSDGVENIFAQWDLALEKNPSENPLELLLQSRAGHDVFALLGAIFAARMAKIPVFATKRLNAILPKVLARLMPGELSVFLTLPEIFSAPDVVQTIAALQNLQLILALGPQSETRAILPQAA